MIHPKTGKKYGEWQINLSNYFELHSSVPANLRGAITI